MAPPLPPLLLEKVLLVTVSVPLLLEIAPPTLALLLEKVLSFTVTEPPSFRMAPPLPPLLPENVLLVTVTEPPLPVRVACGLLWCSSCASLADPEPACGVGAPTLLVEVARLAGGIVVSGRGRCW